MGLRKFIKNRINAIVRWSSDRYDSPEQEMLSYGNSHPNGNRISKGHAGIEDGNIGMNFTVYHATGGKIVQIRSYDTRTDRSTSTLYIVTDKEDLGEEIAHIITRESLTR